ncbi:hypothetical protein DEU56DRAFT_913950 [Suillus clintonianus]|uniref:uncharacterized protein n=1 Tax=Suillus clintonianus TaxID=1904413 RepID=UPI001B860407|nr:uncharacterized protein DEU56DRAFT_913950 [Suillus clintonianus]KAG2133345.1 hypothetical protein DEU56DRAFT_913950 [Suillus clintonianus]
MQKLREVNVPFIDKDALTYLGGLSTVTHISSELPAGSDLEDILGPSCNSILFENFDTVDWEISDWRDVEVFTRLWPHKLTALQLRSEQEFEPDLMQILFDSLHTREAFRSVDIDTKSYLNIDEDDLMEMAEAWPCLEVLFLNEMVGHMASKAPVPRYVTLPGVVRFVERCLLLKKICISISLADVDKEYDMELDKLLDLEPRDSHAALDHVKLRCTREDEILELNAPDECEKAGGLSLFEILLAKLFLG